MTEFEIATLAARQASLWVAAAQVGAALIVGATQAWLIWLGLRAMRRASDSRDRALAAQERAADQRHTEAMRALEALIARTAPAAD